MNAVGISTMKPQRSDMHCAFPVAALAAALGTSSEKLLENGFSGGTRKD